MTAIILESARKGFWKPTPEQLSNVANLHVEMVNKHRPACSGFVCDNAKLRSFISQHVQDQKAQADYSQSIVAVRQALVAQQQDGMVMKKETVGNQTEQTTNDTTPLVVAALIVRKRRRQNGASR